MEIVQQGQQVSCQYAETRSRFLLADNTHTQHNILVSTRHGMIVITSKLLVRTRCVYFRYTCNMWKQFQLRQPRVGALQLFPSEQHNTPLWVLSPFTANNPITSLV